MQALKTQINLQSPEFQWNAGGNAGAGRGPEGESDDVAQGGGDGAGQTHRARQAPASRPRLSIARSRYALPRHFGQLAAFGMYDGDAPAAGLIAGIGCVQGVQCMVVANDAAAKGGTYYPMTVKKHLRAQEIAEHATCPASTSSTWGGAFLQKQDEVFPDRDHFGRIFFNQANMSAKGIRRWRWWTGLVHAGGAIRRR